MLRSASRICTILETQICVKSPYLCRFFGSGVLQSDRPQVGFAHISQCVFVPKPMPEQQQSEVDSSLYTAPNEVRGMTNLDRDAFARTVSVPALRVPNKVINKVVKSLKNVCLKRPGVKRVIEVEGDPNADHRLLLLDPSRVSSPSSFSEAEVEALRSIAVPVELQRYELRLTYENLKTEEVLRAVLPDGQDVTSGFSRVGHIAHMNLRDHQLPYRNLIGQVIIDKNPGVTCAVNKINIIDSAYRNFQMEVLAGDGNMEAKVRENGVTYEFDFSRVYWNPRLSTEHERVVALLDPGATLVDVFAGVGPFTIPSARRGCTVLSNDLNPQSHHWLQRNCQLNKVERRVTTFNLDGRAFIRGPVRQELPALLMGKSGVHVIMNLPALALEFLDAFRGLLELEQEQTLGRDVSLPQVHCYAFTKEDDPHRDVVKRAGASLGVPLEGLCSVHQVRNVAPNKEMMCVSFTIPKEVLFSKHREKDTLEESAPKRQKLEETAV